MATTPKRGYRYPAGTDSPAGMTQLQNLATDLDNDVAALFGMGDWATCGSGNSNVSGTAKVKKVGPLVLGYLSLVCTGGWPNTDPGYTAFALPDTTFAPGARHRMNIGGSIQATPSTLVLNCAAGATSVFVGANGAAANVQLFWYGLLWSTLPAPT